MSLFLPSPWKTPTKCKPLHITVKDMSGRVLSNGVWPWPMEVGAKISVQELLWIVVSVEREQYRDVVFVEPV
jgi:hypothetical protein